MKCKHCNNYMLLDGFWCVEKGNIGWTEQKNKDGNCQSFSPRWYCVEAKREWKAKKEFDRKFKICFDYILMDYKKNKKVDFELIKATTVICFRNPSERLMAGSVLLSMPIVLKIMEKRKEQIEDILWTSPT